MRFARAAAHNRSRQVAAVTGLRVARKNIENDQRVRVKRTEPALVRIARLIAAGDDRVGGNSAGAQNRGIDFGAQNFRGQRSCPTISISFRVRPWSIFAALPSPRFSPVSVIRKARPIICNSFVRFRCALRPEKSVRRAHIDFRFGQLARVTERKIRRHDRRSHAAFSQKMRQHFFVWRRFSEFSLHFALELAERNEFIGLRRLFAPRSISRSLKTNGAFAVLLEKNERIRRQEFGRVKHVGIVLARRDDQAISRIFVISRIIRA